MTENNFVRAFLATYYSTFHNRKSTNYPYHLTCAILINGVCVSIGSNTAAFHAEVNALMNLSRSLSCVVPRNWNTHCNDNDSCYAHVPRYAREIRNENTHRNDNDSKMETRDSRYARDSPDMSGLPPYGKDR